MNKFFSIGKEIITTFLIALLIAVVLKYFFIDSYKILSSSMYPTLQVDDRVIAEKISLHYSDPKRGDIVIIAPPEGFDDGTDYIKRLMGLPGDVIEVRDETLLINGVAQIEDFVNEQPKYDFGPVTVPEGEYLVFGDNRNESFDSHEWPYPFVKREDIHAIAIFTYYPFDRIATHKYQGGE